MRMTALTAYLAGKMSLPPGYCLEHGANVLLTRRKDGSVATTFSAREVAPSIISNKGARKSNPQVNVQNANLDLSVHAGVGREA
jgi:hypothetical protein